MSKNIIIVTAKTSLNYSNYNLNNFLFIGVERGTLDLIEKNIPIYLAIGDFDKITKEELNLIKSKVQNTLVFPKEKDYLDGELAIKKSQELNPKKIFFVANPTKRYDKNLSIMGLIFKYDITFLNEDTMIFLLKKGKNIINFNNYQDKTYVSFFSKKTTIVSIKNMKYNVSNFKLEAFENKCISNTFVPYLNPEIECDQDLICILSK